MATEGGIEQEIAEGTERKTFPLGLSSVLSVASCWKFQVRAINVRRRYGRGTQDCGSHEFEIFRIEQESALLRYRYSLFGKLVLDRGEGNEMHGPQLSASSVFVA